MRRAPLYTLFVADAISLAVTLYGFFNPAFRELDRRGPAVRGSAELESG